VRPQLNGLAQHGQGGDRAHRSLRQRQPGPGVHAAEDNLVSEGEQPSPSAVGWGPRLVVPAVSEQAACLPLAIGAFAISHATS
jgi:hypothetical protein